MTPQELGNILIDSFQGCSFKEVTAHSENDTLREFLKTKLGDEKYKEIDREDPLVWIEALKIFYAHYL